MPNWCLNRLKVWGNTQDVKSFYKQILTVDRANELFSLFLPMPNALHDTTFPFTISDSQARGTITQSEYSRLYAAYGAADWYTWRLGNWGTKWDVSQLYKVQLSEHGKSCHLEFDTANTAPIRAIGHMKSRYPKLKFSLKYNEPGMGYRGKLQW